MGQSQSQRDEANLTLLLAQFVEHLWELQTQERRNVPAASIPEARERARQQLGMDFKDVNIGVTGVSGEGKMDFINAVPGKQPPTQPLSAQPPVGRTPALGPAPPRTAKHKYVAQSEDELSFSKGDTLLVIGPSEDEGWVIGELNGQRGVLPENYLCREKKM